MDYEDPKDDLTDDEAFLSYVRAHSRTERHIFSCAHTHRLLLLARDPRAKEYERHSANNFVSINEAEAIRLIDSVRFFRELDLLVASGEPSAALRQLSESELVWEPLQKLFAVLYPRVVELERRAVLAATPGHTEFAENVMRVFSENMELRGQIGQLSDDLHTERRRTTFVVPPELEKYVRYTCDTVLPSRSAARRVALWLSGAEDEKFGFKFVKGLVMAVLNVELDGIAVPDKDTLGPVIEKRCADAITELKAWGEFERFRAHHPCSPYWTPALLDAIRAHRAP